MSLNFGPVMVLLREARLARACVKAQRKAWATPARWKEGCTKLDVLCRDINIAQHDDVEIDFDFIDASGNPLDVSGFTSLTWIVAQSVRGSILITRTTTDSSLTLPSAFKGRAVLSNAVTGALSPRVLYHELRGINSAGERQTMLTGRFIVQDTRIGDA